MIDRVVRWRLRSLEASSRERFDFLASLALVGVVG